MAFQINQISSDIDNFRKVCCSMYVIPCSLADKNIPYLSYKLFTELQDTLSQKIVSYSITIEKKTQNSKINIQVT
jgi:hypothetical protein